MYFGNNIKFLRKELRLTYPEFSKEIGVSVAMAKSYELINIEPKQKVLISISDLTDISIDDLIRTKITTINFAKLKKGFSNVSAQKLNEKLKKIKEILNER